MREIALVAVGVIAGGFIGVTFMLSLIHISVMALNRQNRIIEANRQPEYNKDIKDERSSDYERDNIHDGRGLQSCLLYTSRCV